MHRFGSPEETAVIEALSYEARSTVERDRLASRRKSIAIR